MTERNGFPVVHAIQAVDSSNTVATRLIVTSSDVPGTIGTIGTIGTLGEQRLYRDLMSILSNSGVVRSRSQRTLPPPLFVGLHLNPICPSSKIVPLRVGFGFKIQGHAMSIPMALTVLQQHCDHGRFGTLEIIQNPHVCVYVCVGL